jgi:peptidoglycan glycosyltransferase
MARHVGMFAIMGVFVAFGPTRTSRLDAQENLQSYLASLTSARRGSAIVIKPASGEILAAWNLQQAVEDAYPPGSTAKIVLSAAALEDSLTMPGERLICQRVPPLLGSAYVCTHPPAPEGFTLSSALANSCNFFFAKLSMREKSDTLLHWYSVFGFGVGAELDGRPTAAGEVRKPSDERSKALAALGEENVVSTAAQLLEAYVLVANHGTEYGLWTSKVRQRRPKPHRRVVLRNSTYTALITGLMGCVRFGTCQAAAVPGVQVAGKTGTSSALDGSGATHAWFVGFAPADKPEIAVVVFLERGTGAHNAAALAGKLLGYYFAETGSTPSQ